MRLTLKQVDAFLALAQTLNFGRAAKLVHLSQPALSATIRRLEEAVGGRLFDRDTRTVALSPAGVEFLQIASDLLETVDNGLARIQRFVSGKQGLLSLGVAPSLAAAFLPSIMKAFSAQFPGVELRLYDVLSDASIDLVRTGKVDLALTPRVAAEDDLVQRDVMRDYLVMICASDDPLARKRSIAWSDLRQRPHIAKKEGSSVRRLIDEEYIKSGEVFRPAFEVENVGTMLGLIVAGLGVGLFPSSTVGSFNMEGLACIPFHPSVRPYRTICAVTLRSRSSNPAGEAFLQLCREKARSQAARGTRGTNDSSA